MPQLPTIDFNTLSRTAFAAGAPITAHDALWGAVFSLPYWYCIARGDLETMHPYISTHSGVADGRPMIKAFTDIEHLQAFAKEIGLPLAQLQILELPVAECVTSFQLFMDEVYGIHFNADSRSDGFFAPLAQLPRIQEHLKKMQR